MLCGSVGPLQFTHTAILAGFKAKCERRRPTFDLE